MVYSLSHSNDNQFLHWPIYPLILFVIVMAIFQVNYLNKSLQFFSASIVTPVNYVFFSTATLVTSAVLFKGFNVTSTSSGVSIVLGFSVIVIGVALLFQYNLKLNKLARAREEAEANIPALGMHESMQTLADSRLSMSDPSGDVDPLTLWSQTFPLRIRNTRLPSAVASSDFSSAPSSKIALSPEPNNYALAASLEIIEERSTPPSIINEEEPEMSLNGA